MFSFDPQFLEHNNTVVTAETLAGEKYTVHMYMASCTAARMAIIASWPRATHWIKALTKWCREWSDGGNIHDAMIYLIRKCLRMDTCGSATAGRHHDDPVVSCQRQEQAALS